VTCDGLCTNLKTDLFNCGRCGHRCYIGDSCLFGVCQSR
jgi:hypothetical protein